MPAERPLLEVDLSVDYANKFGVVRDVSFSLRRGEVLGLVGESGSGKSTIALAILGLLRWKGGRAAGEVLFEGRDLLTLKESQLCKVRGKNIGLVMQSPMASLNSALRIGTQLREAWQAHERGTSATCESVISRSLMYVGLPHDRDFLRRYPAQISVGQAQRVLIAMATIHCPALLIADEPTSALDAMTQIEALCLIGMLNRKRGMAVLYISHDLQSVVSLCHRVAILRNGTIVELGNTESVVCNPQHWYTKQLLSCAPWSETWLQSSGRAVPFMPAADGSILFDARTRTTPIHPSRGLKSPYRLPM